MPGRTFDALEEFILANHTHGDTGAVELLSLSFRRGFGKTITAKNYVGLITMTDGTVIEILPKIYGDVNESDTKRIFLEMLRNLKDVSFKEFNISNLMTDRMNLLEIFILMFASETAALVKQGLKSSYETVEGNENSFKGKLNVPLNIKHNYIRKERFYVRYDQWSINRPENRLIKSTLKLLQKQTGDSHNKLNLSRILSFFDNVDTSTDYDADFSKCVRDRSMSKYQKALSWCKVFLQGNSFTAFTGSEIAIALLFPMERIFESYAVSLLRRFVPPGIDIRTQDTGYSLFEYPVKAFGLRPDIVISTGDGTIVMDAKWKLLCENARNYGISGADMYQMYAYSKKYNADKIVILYPLPGSMRTASIYFKSNDGVNVEAAFIDLLRPSESILALLSKLEHKNALLCYSDYR